MPRRDVTCMLGVFLMLMGVSYGSAQIPVPAEAEKPAGSYPIPGSHLLWKQEQQLRAILALHPEYARPLQKTSAWGFTVGSTHSWYAHDFVSNSDYQTASTCRAVGTDCYIFVEDSLWGGRVTQEVVDSVEVAFDSRTPANASKGIYQSDVDAFGNPPDIDNDPRITILILNIRDGWSGSGGFVAGYFYSLNETTLSGSNQAEIYYLDANPQNLTTAAGLRDGMSTTAHEFQHMIHYNYDPNEITFINEGCSLVAEVNCGFPIYDQSWYVSETNHYLLGWRFNDNVGVLRDYSRAARFTVYLRDLLGMGVFRPIVASTQQGTAGLDAGFTTYGTSLRFADIFKTWVVANDLDDTTVNRAYGYVYKNLPKAGGTAFLSPTVPLTADTIQPLGARYLKFTAGSQLQATFATASASILIKAVEIGASSKRVLDVTPGVQFSEPGFGTMYSEVDFVVMNTDQSNPQIYTYKMTGTGGGAVELKWDQAEPVGYLSLANLDTLVATFDGVPGATLDSVRVGLRRAGSITGGVWVYTGSPTPSPLGTALASPFTASISTTPGIPYPVPWPNWSTVDLRSYAIDASQPFAVGFIQRGTDPTDPKVMITQWPSNGPYHNFTYLHSPSSGIPGWYYLVANSAGDSVDVYLIRAYVSLRPIQIAFVYPGDANNDGVVDVRDILPIGQFYGLAGPSRVGASLTWSAQQVANSWSPPAACYADCDGNGVINASDVQGIIQNWSASRSGGIGVATDRLSVCKALMAEIDQQPRSYGMGQIREAIVEYMKSELGFVFQYTLEQNYPNPFNPSTTIRFSLADAAPRATLSIFNILGEQVWSETLTDVGTGSHELKWRGVDDRGRPLPSGVYIYRISAGAFTSMKRMMLLK